MGQSSYFRDWMLNSTLTGPSAIPLFMALHNSDPEEVGIGELRGRGYNRAAVVFQRTAPGVANNTESIEFDDLPAETVSHFGIWDAAAGGHYLLGGPLIIAQQVESGQALRWRPAELVISMG